MSSKQEHPIQAMGFWVFGFLSVVLAVLKLTVAGYWSWWRVMLPSNPTEFERTTPLVFPRDRGICIITRNLRAWPTERNKQRQSAAAPRA